MKQSEIKNCNGFTFLENLIVVGVILILSLGLIGLINPVRRFAEARDNKRETHLNTIWGAIEQKIYKDKGWENCPSLPTDTFREIGTGPGMIDLYGCLHPYYLSNRIIDPRGGSDNGGRNITDGLVGHWTFDEGEGNTAYDYSGNDNHGTLVNDPDWVDGKIGKALELDGVNDYVEIGHSDSLTMTDGITIAFWAKSHGTQVSWTRAISKGKQDFEFLMSGGGGNTANPALVINGTIRSTAGILIPHNEWVFWAGTWESGSHLRAYLNGDMESQVGPYTGTISSTDKALDIGREWNSSSRFFDGYIDDVRIYDRALSAEEIQDLYNYEYETKYSIWQNAQTGDVSLRALSSETKQVSTNNPSGALSFDGVGDYMEISTISLGNTNWTMSAWVRTSNTGEISILTNSSGGPVTNVFGMNNGKVMYRHYDGIWKYEYGTSSVSDNKWHHLTWVNYSTQNIDLYVDGIMENKGAPSTVTNTGPVNKINGLWNGSGYWNGLLDDFRIYNRALIADEVKALYRGNHITDGLVGYWPLSEMQGCTAYDYSGNDNHGTLMPDCELGDGPEWTTGR
jgi:hypothetical protein